MNQKKSLRGYTRPMAVIAIMSALSIVLMMLEFSIPALIPDFLKFDVSDFPALMTSFAIGPWAGMMVCFLKNLLHLLFSFSTFGVGELANFIISSAFVVPAGLIYSRVRTKSGAMIGAFVGAVVAALFSFPVNYFITYPIYAGFMGLDAIIGAYKAILPAISNLPTALLIFNIPLTFAKGVACIILTFLVYKPLSPILKGKTKK